MTSVDADLRRSGWRLEAGRRSESIIISQLIQYFRACDSYHDFLDRGLLLARKLLNEVITSKVSDERI